MVHLSVWCGHSAWHYFSNGFHLPASFHTTPQTTFGWIAMDEIYDPVACSLQGQEFQSHCRVIRGESLGGGKGRRTALEGLRKSHIAGMLTSWWGSINAFSHWCWALKSVLATFHNTSWACYGSIQSFVSESGSFTARRRHWQKLERLNAECWLAGGWQLGRLPKK